MSTSSTNDSTCWQCLRPASMKCPICLKSNLPTATFCSQECFKQAWPTHKLLHNNFPSSVNETDGEKWPEWLRERPEFVGFKFQCKIRPRRLTPRRRVPDGMEVPDYANREDGVSILETQEKFGIPINNEHDIQMMREACRLGVIVLETAGQAATIGVTTDEIDRIVHEKCVELNVYPSPLNYYKFPKSCCTSVNEVICHGIPDSRPLEDGDIINIDITVYHKGYHADLNETYSIGTIKKVHQNLIRTTHECLEKAISICHPGQMYRQIGECISKHANKNGFSVVRSYCGHGVGKLFHCNPSVPHYAKNRAVGIMKPGHIFTIEPMINEGSWKDDLWKPDNWTATTIDNGFSAQFEHTILITEDGCEVLTRRNWGSHIDRFLDDNQNPTSDPKFAITNKN